MFSVYFYNNSEWMSSHTVLEWVSQGQGDRVLGLCTLELPCPPPRFPPAPRDRVSK